MAVPSTSRLLNLSWWSKFRNLKGLLLSKSLQTSAFVACSHAPESVFDEKMLEFIVCPLSKRPLRYNKASNELVCDDIGVAYPIVNGIPNLVPQDARKLTEDSGTPPTQDRT